MKARKPLSVWIAQIALGGFALALLAELVWLYDRVNPSLSRLSGSKLLVLMLVVGIWILVVASLGWIVYAIQMRRNLGRILGLIALLAMFAIWLYIQFFPAVNAPGYRRYQNDAEEGLADILNTLCFILFWIFFGRFGFSKKSRKFFQIQPDAN